MTDTTHDHMQRLDDLTADEGAAIVQAYDSAVASDTHEEAFALASDMLQRLRPDMPSVLVAIELEMLLAFAPAETAALQYA